MRQSSTYSCTVYVTSRTNIGIAGSDPSAYRTVQEGNRTSTVNGHW